MMSLSIISSVIVFTGSFYAFFLFINTKTRLETVSKYQHFYKLYIQVKNFNTLVDTVNAINISEETGGSNKLEDKDKVYSILKTLRADLILALNIERNFRENPHFSFNLCHSLFKGNILIIAYDLEIRTIAPSNTSTGRSLLWSLSKNRLFIDD